MRIPLQLYYKSQITLWPHCYKNTDYANPRCVTGSKFHWNIIKKLKKWRRRSGRQRTFSTRTACKLVSNTKQKAQITANDPQWYAAPVLITQTWSAWKGHQKETWPVISSQNPMSEVCKKHLDKPVFLEWSTVVWWS